MLTTQTIRNFFGTAAMLALSIPTYAAVGMSGIYTVCSSGCDYSTIQAASNDLSTYGVSGPVLISIAAGTYTESVHIRAISGTDSANTVTFRGAGNHNRLGTVINGANSNFSGNVSLVNAVLSMYDANWVRLENMLIVSAGTSQGDYAVYLQGCMNTLVGQGVSMEGARGTGSIVFNGALVALQTTDCALMGVTTNFGLGVQTICQANLRFKISQSSLNGRHSKQFSGYGYAFYSYIDTNLSINMTTIKDAGLYGLVAFYSTNTTVTRSQIISSGNTQAVFFENSNPTMDVLENNYIVSYSKTNNTSTIRYADASGSSNVMLRFAHNTVWSDSASDGTMTGPDMTIDAPYSPTGTLDVGNNIFHSNGRYGNQPIVEFPDYSLFSHQGYNVYSMADSAVISIAGTDIGENSSDWDDHQDNLDNDFGTMDIAEMVSFNLSYPNSRQLSAQGPRSDFSYGLPRDNENDSRCVDNPTIGADEFTNTSRCGTPLASVAVENAEADFTLTLLGNPTAEAFRFISSEDAVATLWTLTGAQVGSINAQAGYVNTLGSSLPAGQYILRVATASGVKNLSVVKL